MKVRVVARGDLPPLRPFQDKRRTVAAKSHGALETSSAPSPAQSTITPQDPDIRYFGPRALSAGTGKR